ISFFERFSNLLRRAYLMNFSSYFHIKNILNCKIKHFLLSRISNFAKKMMEVFNTPHKVIITCNRRLSPYLAQEVEALGFEIVRSFNTGVEVHASVNECIRLN